MQDFRVVKSEVTELHVLPSHFPSNTFGKVEDAEKDAVQPEDVGSVMQLLIGDKSVFKFKISDVDVVHVELSHFKARTDGKLVAAGNSDVQAEFAGSSIQLLTAAT